MRDPGNWVARRRPGLPSLSALLAACALLSAQPAPAGGAITARKAALSTASPLATRAGLSILQRGGSAADAAVASAFALAVVHPQAGNLGGGGFLVYYDAATGGVWTLDFRETAPRDVNRETYAKSEETSRTGPLAAGVPGTVAGLEALHAKFGKLPWSDLLESAWHLAHDGVPADQELRDALAAASRERKIDQFPSTASMYFGPEGIRAVPVTTDLAETIVKLADKGPRDFYEGDLAKKIVEGVRASGGVIGFRDLREYRPVWRAPLKLGYGKFDIYTVPPPSGGGLVLGEALAILGQDGPLDGPGGVHRIVEAQRRAFIDRNRYLGDPLTARIPYRQLLSPERAKAWRATIDPKRASATIELSEPANIEPEAEHTTHFSIADADGNVLALTTTLGEDFGSGFVVPGLGFFLNSAMDDFTTSHGRANRDGLVQGRANQVDPQKRPASSLCPVIVLRENRPVLALGSRGGPAIPTTILQILLDVVVAGHSLPDAVAAPRYHHQAIPDSIFFERPLAPQSTIEALNQMGHGVVGRESIGDVHAIQFAEDRIVAVADPRRGGAAGGY